MLGPMLADRDRALPADVVADVVGAAAEAEWVTPTDGWSARARLHSATGLVSHLLTSLEWQEARFEDPRCCVLILTTTEEDDVRAALAKLARASAAYLAGGGHVERRRGLFGTRSSLVLHTADGEWRIGRRSGSSHNDQATDAHGRVASACPRDPALPAGSHVVPCWMVQVAVISS